MDLHIIDTILFRGIILSILFFSSVAIILFSRRRKIDIYIMKWGVPTLWILAFFSIAIYTVFYYRFWYQAVRDNTYELIGIYSTFYFLPIILFLAGFIILQLKHIRSFKKRK